MSKSDTNLLVEYLLLLLHEHPFLLQSTFPHLLDLTVRLIFHREVSEGLLILAL